MTEQEKEDWLDTEWQEWSSNYIDGCAQVMEEGE
jgi:hypothetical protein